MSKLRLLPQEISAHRELSALSLQDVARRAGITKSHLWDLEQGRSTNPTIATILGLAKALAIPELSVAEWALNSRRAASAEQQKG